MAVIALTADTNSGISPKEAKQKQLGESTIY